MNIPPLQWETQRVFLAVLRTGSLSAAARALGIAQATARRRIDSLEHSVGTSLFVRSPAGLMPTDTARELVDHAQSMALAAEAFARAASAQANVPGGTVRVTSSQLLGVEVLPSMLGEIRAAQPRLAVELSDWKTLHCRKRMWPSGFVARAKRRSSPATWATCVLASMPRRN